MSLGEELKQADGLLEDRFAASLADAKAGKLTRHQSAQALMEHLEGERNAAGWVRPEVVTHQDEKQGWRDATLGEFVATKTRGIVPNKTPGATFELYSVPSLDTGSPEIVRGGEIGSNKQIVDEGTVLLCKINPRINRSWVVSSHTVHQKIASTEWITFPPNEAFEPKYLAYYLKQDTVRDFLAANASGVGGSLMRVKPATLKDYVFPLAPLDQQKRIVAEIEKHTSRLDEAVASLKRVKANLKRYKTAVLKAAVEGRLVETEAARVEAASRRLDQRQDAAATYETGEQLLQRILETRRSQWQGKGKYKEPAVPDTTALPELPEGWVAASIGQLSLFSFYGPRFSSEDYATTGPFVLRTTDISESGRVDTTAAPRIALSAGDFAKYRVERGDLLVTRTGSLETLALFDDEVDAIPGAYLIQFRLCLDWITRRYLFLCL